MAIDLFSPVWQPARNGEHFAYWLTRVFAQLPGASARVAALAQRPEVLDCRLHGWGILRCLAGGCKDTFSQDSVVDDLGRCVGVREAMIEILDEQWAQGRTNLKEVSWQPAEKGLAFGYFVTRLFARMPEKRIEQLADRPEMAACPERGRILALLKGGCRDGFSQFCALDEINKCSGLLAAMVDELDQGCQPRAE